ncbi:MAG TPA: class I SAM-dependent methyltransferase [Solirubrobacteraceae bacterium]|nr:class I SAM-dependent methyltransferase [Solirubrobacteraceae bacterium]
MSSSEATAGASTFEEALRLIDGVEGWLSEGQARMLWDCAREVRAPGRIVEIGSFRGRSMIVLASAAAPGVELVAIDPHGGSDRGPQEIAADARRGDADNDAFESNLSRAGVRDRVRHVRMFAREAVGEVAGDIDLLYIDGAHRYQPVREDIELWGARVAPAGTMLMHDAFNAIGVTLAQLRLLLLSSTWRYQGRERSLARYRRARLDPRARARNALGQLGGLPYFVRNLVVKVLIVAKLRSLAALLGCREDWPY